MPPSSRKRRSNLDLTVEGENKICTPKQPRKRESKKSRENKNEKKDSKNDSGLPSLNSSFNGNPEDVSKTSKTSSPKKISKQRSGTKGKKSQNESLPVKDVNSMDVAQLLALGESSQIVDCEDEKMSVQFEDSSDSGMSDFEEVKDIDQTEPIIPEGGVDITLDVPNIHHKHKKKGVDIEGHLRRQLNRVKKDMQLLMHKVHLLCWIAHIKFVNNILNCPDLMKSCLTIVKSKNLYPKKFSDLTYLEGILKWFHKTIELKKNFEDSKCTGGLLKELSYQIESKQSFSFRDYTFLFVSLLRVLGLKVRIVMSFQVIPVKPAFSELYDIKSIKLKKAGNISVKTEEEVKQEKDICSLKTVENADSLLEINKGASVSTCDMEKSKVKSRGSKSNIKNKDKGKINDNKSQNFKKSEKSKKCEDENSDDEFQSKHFKPSVKKAKEKAGSKLVNDKQSQKNNSKSVISKNKSNSKKTDKKVLVKEENDDSDGDFTPVSLKKKDNKRKPGKKSSESAESTEPKKKENTDVWAEVYLESEEKWFSIDVPRQKVHCVSELYSRATHPVIYIVACNNDSTLKDITKRYVPNWHSDTRKRRVDDEWWNETMRPYLPANTAQDREEDEDINRQLTDKPLPSVIAEYKDHPLYALKRHLLKFEAIYPPNAPTLGFVRGEPVYARECVVILHSREMWYKQARVVRLKEEPYKTVKARPKYDKMTGEFKKDLPLELYGFWQTEDFIPPIAVDGKVPRNEYGNVDLFKPCMLPIGTVYLQIPALNRVAKKLNIDCAPATVGFEFHSGGSHPIFDGFVVCEEFKEILLDAWNKEIDESAKRNEEKKEKRVYGNWKKLIRGVLIREKLKIKYSFGGHSDEEDASTSKAVKLSVPSLSEV